MDSGHTWFAKEDFAKALKDLEASRNRCRDYEMREDLLRKEIKELESILKEAEELLAHYNEWLKRDNKSAEKLGTTIDDYFSKYSKEG